MSSGFFPDDRESPREWRTDDLWLRVLRPDVTELDYDALMESRARLRLWSDSEWPADDFTLELNRADLVKHEREWEAREAFAYTVLSPDGARCEGCVYISPWHRPRAQRRIDSLAIAPDAGADTALVSFWVRESALARELDRQLLDGLRAWFRAEWPFGAVFYRINDHQRRDRELLEAAGMRRLGSHPAGSPGLLWHVYSA